MTRRQLNKIVRKTGRQELEKEGRERERMMEKKRLRTTKSLRKKIQKLYCSAHTPKGVNWPN